MSEQERRVGRVYYTRARARAGNPDIDPFHYDDAPEAKEEVRDNEQEQLLNQGAESYEQQESELVNIQQTDEQDVHQEGWYCDCYPDGQVEEAEALAITRAKAKGPINWKDKKDVRDKVHEKVQKEQVQYAEEENEELEIPKKQQKLAKAGLLPIKEDKDWFEEPVEGGQALEDCLEKNEQVDQEAEIVEAVETVPVDTMTIETMIEDQGVPKLHEKTQHTAEQV
ncbi:hypothetical protein L7F22_015162 [Adiantum nelumboides]|nr:hypothetical protein [Adiantum nelumboides]